MPLIDFITDITSFNYDKIGKKQGEYFGEEKATGFTPNRNAGDGTEYSSKSIFNDGLKTQIETGNDDVDVATGISTFDYKKIEKKHGEYFGEEHATGFTPKRKAGDTTEYSSKSIFNGGLDTQIKTGVNYIKDSNATGYTTSRTTKDIDTDNSTFAGEYKIGTSEYDGIKTTSFVKGEVGNQDFTIQKGFVKNIKTKVDEDLEYSDYPLDDIKIGKLSIDSTKLLVLHKSRLDIPQETRITSSPNRVQKIHLSADHPYSLPVRRELFDRYDEIKDDLYTKFGGNAGLRAGNYGNPGDANEPSFNLINSQPFIIKEVLDGYDSSIKYDEGIMRGGALLNGVRVGEDIVRLGKWATTTPGLLFGAKQLLLQRGLPEFDIPGNARRETRAFNPLGIFGSIVPTIHMPRHFGKNFNPLPSEPGKYNDVNNPPNSQYHVDEDGEYNITSNPVFMSDVSNPPMRLRENNPYEDFNSAGKVFPQVGEDGKTLPTKDSNIQPAAKYGLGSGLVRTKLGKLYSAGVSNALQVRYGGKFGDLTNSMEKLPKDFVKFRIRDAVNGKWIIFPAHLGTISDAVSPEWTTEKYIGRPDNVHIYTGANRTISLEFKVAAFSKQEIPIIQEKMNALVGLGYPTYKKTFSDDDELRPVAPYIYLTIGDLFNNTPGYFSNISLTFEETSTWEIDDGLQIPQYFNVSVEFVHIGKFIPTTVSKHYDFPNLQQHDTQYGVFKGNPRDEMHPEVGDVSILRKAGEWMKDSVTGELDNKKIKWATEAQDGIDNFTNDIKSDAKDTFTDKLKETFNWG